MSAGPDHSTRAHALLGASSSSRWLACTPSARAGENAAEYRVDTYADEGELAHELCEVQLRSAVGRISTRSYRTACKRIRSHELYGAYMEECADGYVDYVLGVLAAHPGAELLIEERLDYSKYVPEGYGTGDVVIVAPGFIHVIDYKNGGGIVVDATENTQGMLYGLGALETWDYLYDIKRVHITIFQPRRDNISEWSIDAEELRYWAKYYVAPRAKDAWEGKAGLGLNPGNHCRFCNIKTRCKARIDWIFEVFARLESSDFAEPPTVIDLEEMLAINERVPAIKKYADAVSDELYARALKGEKIPGAKLVRGRGRRVISDPDAAENTLVALGYDRTDVFKEPKLRGLGDLTKLLGKPGFKEYLGPLVNYQPGALKLVPADAPGEEVVIQKDLDLLDDLF